MLTMLGWKVYALAGERKKYFLINLEWIREKFLSQEKRSKEHWSFLIFAHACTLKSAGKVKIKEIF